MTWDAEEMILRVGLGLMIVSSVLLIAANIYRFNKLQDIEDINEAIMSGDEPEICESKLSGKYREIRNSQFQYVCMTNKIDECMEIGYFFEYNDGRSLMSVCAL